MFKVSILVLFVLSNIGIYAHRGDVLAIENVKVSSSKEHVIYMFDIENIAEKYLFGIQVEIIVNGKSLQSLRFDTISNYPKFRSAYFRLEKREVNPELDKVQIEIIQIFNQKRDWGGWDSPNRQKQVNTIASEFYADAPWRMSKSNASGTDQPVPIHFFLHEADLVTGYTLKIDYINIKVKNASASGFGPVLTYDGVPTSELDTLFTSLSQYNSYLSIKAFDLNSFTATSSRTFDFDKESDFFDEYVSIDDTYWYFTFNIPPADLAGLENIIDVQATISYANLAIPIDDVISMRIFRSDYDIPSVSNYYRGDTHLHSMFTQNEAEIGLPMEATKEAGELIGLDWITTTDHTSDFDNYGNEDIHTNWNLIQSIAAVQNSEEGNLIFIAGQEVAVNNSDDKLVHMLAYPPVSGPFDLPFLGDGDGDLSATSVSIDDVISQLNAVNGFSYAAHPYATEDKLPLVPVDGGIWNLGSDGFPSNGDDFPETGGEIICNDLSLESDILSIASNRLIKDAIRGGQIWNTRTSLSVSGISGNEFDPWDVENSGTPMSQVDTASFGFHFKMFRQGMEVVNYINQRGLALKNSDSTVTNWQMYYAGGSDAHGSFNFSNTGNIAGLGSISNTAVGKVNTLVYCPNGMGNNGSNVLKALYNGNSSISDGPVLTMGISTNGDDQINEYLMGNAGWIDPSWNDLAYLNFSYATTPEYGDIVNFNIIVGTDTGEIRKTFVLPETMGSHITGFRLIDVMDSIFGVGDVPQKTYIYVRAEMQTNMDYSTSVGIYRTNFDIFHGITNPIWIRYEETPEPPIPDDFTVYPNPFTDQFSIALPTGNKYNRVSVYNTLGELIITQSVSENPINIDMRNVADGIYTIGVDGDGDQHLFGKVVKVKE